MSTSTTTTALERLALALEARLELIADAEFRNRDPEAHLAALREASRGIEQAAHAIPGPLDPNLAHYLGRSSYDKALAWLRSRPS